MIRRKLCFERCERRDLLAADLGVWHDPVLASDPVQQPGQQVTRVVRVFNDGDEAAWAEVNSSLTTELQNPTWHRQRTRGREVRATGDLVQGRSLDFSVAGLSGHRGLRRIGDINGDGKQDFAYALHSGEHNTVNVLLGGLGNGGDAAEGSVTYVIQARDVNISESWDASPLGDLDNDGFDDFSVAGFIIWGAAETLPGSRVTVSRNFTNSLWIEDADSIRSVGDVNGDARADLVIRTNQANVLVWGREGLRQAKSIKLSEWTSAAGHAVFLQGPGVNATSAGDLNADGFADFVLSRPPVEPHHAIATVVFGGTHLSAMDSIDLDQQDGTTGFHVTNLADAHLYRADAGGDAGVFYDTRSIQAHSDGDVNGDGIDDLLTGFDGSYLVGDYGRAFLDGGAILVLGGQAVGGNGVIDKVSSQVSSYRISANHGAMLFPQMVDANGDGRQDLLFRASYRSHVVFGQERMISRDFGRFIDEYRGFDGGDGYTLHAKAEFVDIDGDGTTDLLSSDGVEPAHVYLDSLAFEYSFPTIGAGDIREVIYLPAGSGISYTVRGQLREQPAATIVTTVAPRRIDLAEDLLDNTAGAPPSPFLGLDVNATSQLVAGESGTIQVTIANAGPVAAEHIQISESVSSLFDDPAWSKTTQMFPAAITRERATQLGAFAVAGIGPQEATAFGRDAPTRIGATHALGDVNGDGYRDIFVQEGAEARIVLGGSEFGHDGTLSSGGGQLYLKRAHSSPRITKMVGIGDVNDDGIDDIAGTFSQGGIFLLLGRSDWNPAGQVLTVPLEPRDLLRPHNAVRSVRSIGDVNGDGRTDLAVSSGSRYYLVTDSGSRIARLQDHQRSAGARWATSQLVSVGDVNADGFDDVVVLANSQTDAPSQSRLVFGNATIGTRDSSSLMDLPGFSLPGEMFLHGDFNGDGVDDIAVDWGAEDKGYVLYGGHGLTGRGDLNLDELDGEIGFQWVRSPSPHTAEGLSAHADRRLVLVADVNGDGMDDLVSGHGENACATAGPIYVNYGRAKSAGLQQQTLHTDGANGFRLDWSSHGGSGPTGNDICIVADDLNGDGVAEMVLTELDQQHMHHGMLYAFMGHPSDTITGVGQLEASINLPAGASVTYHVQGWVRQDLLHRAQVSLGMGEDRTALSRLLMSQTLLLAPLTAQQADLNGDGHVGFADFLVLSNNYGRADAALDEGDLDGDRRVDFGDFLLLRQLYEN